MPDPGPEPSESATPDAELETKPPERGPGWGDVAAVGIGCLVFVIFFVAIVLVGMGRR